MQPIAAEPLIRHDLPDGGRFYEDSAGRMYASVTHILKKTSTPGYHLKKWLETASEVQKKRAADRGKIGSARGHKLHAHVENFLLNGVEGRGDYYWSLRPFLDRVSDVRALELQVKHEKMRYAGTLDAWCKVDGKPALVDWKTAFKPKKAEWIEDYYLQCAAYAAIIRHVFGEMIEHAYVVIAIGGRRRPVLKVKKTARSRKYAAWFSKLRAKFCCKVIECQVFEMNLQDLEKAWKLWKRRVDRYYGRKLKRKKSLPASTDAV